MVSLNRAPTPKEFANAWTRGFARAVRDAAGRDGRLSRSEAAKILARGDDLAQYGDNAAHYLEAKGQKSVSVDKLIGKAHDYAFATAAKVAGSGGRVSLEEARGLPADLRADFFALRGKAAPSEKLDAAALGRALEAAATTPEGQVIHYISESDYPVLPVAVDNPTGKVDAATVFKLFEAHLSDGTFEDVVDYRGELTAEAMSKKDSAAFLKDLATPWDGMDEGYSQLMVGFQNIKSLLDENVSELRVVKVGPKMSDGSLGVDRGLYNYFIVGQTEDGKLAGVSFGSVET